MEAFCTQIEKDTGTSLQKFQNPQESMLVKVSLKLIPFSERLHVIRESFLFNKSYVIFKIYTFMSVQIEYLLVYVHSSFMVISVNKALYVKLSVSNMIRRVVTSRGSPSVIERFK